jgi:hypothetical protein
LFRHGRRLPFERFRRRFAPDTARIQPLKRLSSRTSRNPAAPAGSVRLPVLRFFAGILTFLTMADGENGKVWKGKAL